MSDAPLRVAWLVNQYPKLSHSFVRREIRALERRGVEVVRLSLRRADEVLRNAADREEAERTRVVLDVGAAGLATALVRTLLVQPVGFVRALAAAVSLAWHARRRRLVHAAYLAEACVLRHWLGQPPVAHVHAHFGTNAAAVALLLHRLGGPPYSFTVHGPEEFDAPESLGLPRKIAEAAFVVGVSQFGRSQLMRWSRPEDWDRLHVVHCGLDDRLLGGGDEAHPAAPRLTCIGRLCIEKGQHVLVEAVGRLASRGVDVELRIGGEGPLRPVLERRIAELGLGDRVRLLGAVAEDEVRREMLAARAVVLPSFAEGLPVTLMEALALGRPVVTTTVAGIPELVRHGECGWLLPPGDVEALAGALAEVLEAPTERLARMGAAGAARVARRHDVERSAARLANLVRSRGAAAETLTPSGTASLGSAPSPPSRSPV